MSCAYHAGVTRTTRLALIDWHRNATFIRCCFFDCTNLDTDGGALRIVGAFPYKTRLAISESTFGSCLCFRGRGGAICASHCKVWQFASNCFQGCQSKYAVHVFAIRGFLGNSVNFALNSLFANGFDSFPRTFDIENVTFRFTQTNLTSNEASFAHSFGAKDVRVVSISASNFVKNDGASGFLRLGVPGAEELMTRCNIIGNSFSQQLIRFHSFLTVDSVSFFENTGRYLARVDMECTIRFVRCQFDIMSRQARITGTPDVGIFQSCKFGVRSLEFVAITFNSQKCILGALQVIDDDQPAPIVTPEKLLALGFVVSGLAAVALLSTLRLARKGRNRPGARFSTA
jgi:hypothetical protein